jgi:4-hydroxy-tetrahydrodipicolinate synthase
VITTNATLFGRVITAMVTPFDDAGKIDFKAVEKLVNYFIATGTTSLVVSGTTGESPTLKDSEKVDLFKAVKDTAGKRAKLIMGTGYNSTEKSIEATREAEQLGTDGILAVAPYYNKPSQDGLLAHFSAIADATHLPIFVYNIPGRTGVNITVDTTIELTQRHANIYALKDSTGNVEQAADIAGKVRPDFVIYSGDDNLTLPFLSIGACGVISVASQIIGGPITEMMDHFFSGRLDEARKLHYEYLPLFKGLFAAPNPTCIKFALSTLGLCKPNLRLPLVPLSPSQQETMKALLKQSKVELEAAATK